jgi:uncharacterized protein (DUF2164 family)
MRIKLSDERRSVAVESLRSFYSGEFDEELSEFRAERILDFAMKHLGPPLYNQAVADARGYMASKLEDIDGELYEAEVFTASLDSFDCVTYVESVLALAVSNTVSQFVQNLRLIRYRSGRVGWRTRNHYMSGWIRQNTGAGFVRNQTRGRALVRRDRRLNVVVGLPERTVSVSSVPKSDFCRRLGEVETGDLIFFASTRKNLDIFHCGILIRSGRDLVMRHAARSRGGVVEQPLRQFLKANRMVGVIVVRPEDAFPRAA